MSGTRDNSSSTELEESSLLVELEESTMYNRDNEVATTSSENSQAVILPQKLEVKSFFLQKNTTMKEGSYRQNDSGMNIRVDLQDMLLGAGCSR